MHNRQQVVHVFVPTGALLCGTQMHMDVKSPHEACICLTACHTPFRIRVGDAPEQSLTAVLASYEPRRIIDARGARFMSLRITPLHPLFRRLHGGQELLPLDRTLFSDLDASLLDATHGRLTHPATQALFEEVVLRTARLLPEPAPRDPRINQAIELARTIEPEPSLADIAQAIGMSRSRLSHLWTEHVGMPLRSFLTWRRTARAGGLLVYTQMPITEIAHRMGFSDSAHFSRTFHRYTGQTPTELRENQSVVVPNVMPPAPWKS
jgi:AraC-like DNA-binding protein